MPLPSLKRLLLQFKFEVRSVVAREPMLAVLHKPVIWWTKHKNKGIIDVRECAVDDTTVFVIDGFQGSGNSFATVAFKRSQPTPVRLAHHLHSPAQIIKAAQQKIPTLITIREPKGAAISLVSRWPYVSLTQAVRGYIHFYEKIEPYAASMVVSPFHLTTRQLDLVIRAVNKRYDTNFGLFGYDDADMQELRGSEKLQSDKEIQRAAVKKQMAEQFDREVDPALYQQALAVYHRIEKYSLEKTMAPTPEKAGS
ncbi:MAG: hypothetical protein AAF564_23635 [Bacteroidota bacterium]